MDAAFATWLSGYHQRTHSETGLTPTAGWVADGWLPRTTDTPEQLDLLLVVAAATRVVHRDGIRFQGVRYLNPVWAASTSRTSGTTSTAPSDNSPATMPVRQRRPTKLSP